MQATKSPTFDGTRPDVTPPFHYFAITRTKSLTSTGRSNFWIDDPLDNQKIGEYFFLRFLAIYRRCIFYGTLNFATLCIYVKLSALLSRWFTDERWFTILECNAKHDGMAAKAACTSNLYITNIIPILFGHIVLLGLKAQSGRLETIIFADQVCSDVYTRLYKCVHSIVTQILFSSDAWVVSLRHRDNEIKMKPHRIRTWV